MRCDGRKLSGTEMQMTILTFLPYFLLISFVHETTERDISPGNGNIDSRRNEREILAVYSPSRNAIIYNNTRIDESQTCHSAKPCRPGVLIPIWQPQTGISGSTKFFRACVYLIAMLYLFFGVSIVADRFMAAIEVITSQEREVKVVKVTGEQVRILVRVWNETVSNLTLMALGSSAPEILLSVIEIFGNNFEAGDLGPSTIVGSAAFNLFVIVAICICVVPSDEIRRVYRIDVFWITVFWSTIAYVWLYLILCVFSPNVIDVWEGILTLMFFPLTVVSAFLANKHARAFGQRLLSANITSFRRTPLRTGAPRKSDKKKAEMNGANLFLIDDGIPDKNPRYLELIRQLRTQNPDLSIHDLEKLATTYIISEAPKSRAFYRIQATRMMTGQGDLLSKTLKNRADEQQRTRSIASSQLPLMPDKPKEVVVRFDPTDYVCLENVGTINVRVCVDRGSLVVPTTVQCHYKTVADTASEYEDFVPAEGMLTFAPNQTERTIEVPIVDNEVYEDDEQFHVRLFNSSAFMQGNESQYLPCRIAEDCATVLIIDDDHSGAFSFVTEAVKVPENHGILSLEVRRHRGARGVVNLPYKCIDGSAKAGRDFVSREGNIVFHDGQTKEEILIQIINDDEYEKSEEFYVELEEPILLSKFEESQHPKGSDAGKPILGEHQRVRVTITEDKEFKNFVDKLITNANTSLMVGTSSWKQQFKEAIKIEDLDGDGEISCKEKFLHWLSLPWKLVFALIPPTDYSNGWITFFVAIFAIGVLTALIGDVASMFGCTIGLKDIVTAITLVAMGTSLPDTFASKTAAIQDKTADSSIGNVTGSNAVNVFLGIGLAWAIAAVHHSWNGTEFRVEAGDLASSVTLFLLGSIVCFGILQWRRFNPNVRGELGGPLPHKLIAFAVFISVWLIYILYSSLIAYCILPGF